MIKQTIDQDLKTAMLAGDKQLVSTLRGLKSVILYGEVASSKREEGLSDPEVIALLQKESKKRLEAAELYEKSNNSDKAATELYEKEIIDGYLPNLLSEQEVGDLVERIITELGEPLTPQTMGKVISSVKEAAAGSAEGAMIAKLVKERIQS